MLRIRYWLQSRLYEDSEWNDECWSDRVQRINRYLSSCKLEHCSDLRIIVRLEDKEITPLDYTRNASVYDPEFIDYLTKKYYTRNDFIDSLPWKESKTLKLKFIK